MTVLRYISDEPEELLLARWILAGPHSFAGYQSAKMARLLGEVYYFTVHDNPNPKLVYPFSTCMHCDTVTLGETTLFYIPACKSCIPYYSQSLLSLKGNQRINRHNIAQERANFLLHFTTAALDRAFAVIANMIDKGTVNAKKE